MSIVQQITEGIALLKQAGDKLNSLEAKLWKESDEAKANGQDWVPANAAGNACGQAGDYLDTLVNNLDQNISYIPKMLIKHEIGE